MKMSLYGAFDSNLEASVREQLLTEFNEQSSWSDRCGEWTADDFGEMPDGFDFAACQRADGSVYPIASGKQCRRGTPISVRPGDKHRDIMKKGQAAGLKVRSILEENDKLRAEKGLKVVRGERAIQSLARRLNERMGHGGRPEVVKSVKSVDDAVRVTKERREAKKAQKAAENKPSQQVNKRFLRQETTQKLQQYLDGRKLYAYQRKAIEAELERRAKAGQAPAALRAAPKSLSRQKSEILQKIKDEVNKPGKLNTAEVKRLGQRLKDVRAKQNLDNKTPKSSAAKPLGLDKDAQIIVNKKLLGQKTEILQRILEERSLNPKQRAKIEEEVGARGETPAQAKRLNKREIAAAGKTGKGWSFTKGVDGYDPIQAFARPDNQLLAEGSMGKAFLTKGPPPGVVKKGQIGEFEVEAWQKLQGTGRVPEFHGAAVSPRLKDVDYGLGGHVRESKGFLGIGEARGRPIAALGLTDPAERRALIDEYIRTRRDIHLAGVAHNDMHGGNVFYDRSTGKMQAIDFGLAQVSHKAALIEALSTRGGDWQADNFISRWKPSGDEPPAHNQFMRNQRALLRILDNQGYDSDWITSIGIRSKPEKIDEVLDGMSEAEARTYLKALYKGV